MLTRWGVYEYVTKTHASVGMGCRVLGLMYPHVTTILPFNLSNAAAISVLGWKSRRLDYTW